MYSDEFGLVSFQVDHIIAVKHGGSDEIDNLALSCIHCNQHKGSDLSSYDFRSEEIIPLFNPRKHHWRDHFHYDNERIVPITQIGYVTVNLLQMNHQERLNERFILLELGVFDHLSKSSDG